MRSLRFPHVLLFGAAVLAVLALAALRVADHFQGGRTDAVYTLEPRPDKGIVVVRMDIRGLRPGRLLLLAPQSDRWEMAGPPGRTDGGPPTAERGPEFWWANVESDGHLLFEYEIKIKRLDSRHALLVGNKIFAIPLRTESGDKSYPVIPRRYFHEDARRIMIQFDLPRRWSAYTPWGEAYPTIDIPGGRFDHLRAGFFALGDYLPRRFEAAGASVELVIRQADPQREDQLETLIRDCLKAHTEFVGGSPHENLFVIVSHPYRGDQAAGRTSLNSAYLDLSSNPRSFESRSTVRVVAHELFHLWNGGAVNLDPDNLRWFAEGVTDYYALRALAASGYLSLGELANELAATLDRLEGNPWADSSLASLGSGYATDAQAWSATYAKGAIAAWALDLRLQPAGGLDGVMRPILQRGRRPDPERALSNAGGGRARGLLDSLSGPGYRKALERELATQDLQLVREPSGQLTLGLRFFRPGTTEILDLDPMGPAARSGLRSGDRVVAVNRRPVRDLEGVAEAFSDSRGGPLELLVDRDGTRALVRLQPQPGYATRVVATPPGGLAAQHPAPGELP